MLVIHNETLADFIHGSYALRDVEALLAYLEGQGTLEFPALPNGLFPAAVADEATDEATAAGGYDRVWVRDNIHIAHAHYVMGKVEVAVKTVRSLMAFFTKYRERFVAAIEGRVDVQNPDNRPHVRFNGATLSENEESWPHAQNDALGYFLWLFCLLVRDDAFELTPEDVETLALFPLYFEAIAYWQDEDSGHWEEARKIEASSIGTAIAGLRALQQLQLKPAFVAYCCQYEGRMVTPQLLRELIGKGEAALAQILPAECAQADLSKYRQYDGALLFLIYPLGVVSGTMASRIVRNVQVHLERDYGICRYLGDSFWFANYRQLLAQETFIGDLRHNNQLRDRFLRPGQEAQWCLFDPILSVIFGLKFQSSGQSWDLERQVHYLNRSLGQITGQESPFGGFKCPELYHLEGEEYVPSDATPLLWTQANLVVALKMMAHSAQLITPN